MKYPSLLATICVLGSFRTNELGVPALNGPLGIVPTVVSDIAVRLLLASRAAPSGVT
jgi:hypothetical protein